jgi:hypothetical protein
MSEKTGPDLAKRIILWTTCIATAEKDPAVKPEEIVRLKSELADMQKEQLTLQEKLAKVKKTKTEGQA